MNIIKEKLFDHLINQLNLINNDELSVNQMGFTRGRRIQDNLLSLHAAICNRINYQVEEEEKN